MADPKFVIFAISDATGELAVGVATAALRQFKQEGVPILRRARIRNLERLAKVVKEAADVSGLIIFTLVSQELRDGLRRLAQDAKVEVVDVMGPIMDLLSKRFEVIPSDQPGLKYQITGDYFRRNEAIEFTVKHDDGQGLESLEQADIVLLGISRTSKTPLSIYLAYRGFKTANIPIIHNLLPPSELHKVNSKKLVGLTVFPQKLVELRSARLTKLGLSPFESYADIESIRQELEYSHRIFLNLGKIPVIDVTSKAIEEVASEVLATLGL